MRLLRCLPFLLLITALLFFHPLHISQAQQINSDPQQVFLPILFHDWDPLWNLQAPSKVILQPVPLSKPFLIIDSSGRAHLLWDTWSGNKTFIYHTYLTETGWTPATPIQQTLGRSKLLNPPVAGKNNQIYLVWYNEETISGPYRILYSAWDGTKWGPEYELIGQGKSSNLNGMVRLDDTGTPNVAYLDSDYFFTSLIYYQKWAGNGFSPKIQVDRPNSVSYTWLDSHSGLRFYGDNSQNGVNYSYWKDGTFLDLDRAIPGRINSRTGILDQQNNLHLIRSASVPIPGGSVPGLFHQCLQKDLNWSSEEVLSGSNRVLSYFFGFDDNLETIAAWSHTNNQTISTRFWNGCQITAQREINLPANPGNIGWGTFLSIAKNSEAQKVCLLSQENYSSSTLWLTCSQ